MKSTLLRKIALSAALIWLPMSVFAQICATHSLVMSLGGQRHPAMIMAHEVTPETPMASTDVVVLDAATFWASVDSFDDGCDQIGVCALASVAAPSLHLATANFEPASPRVFHETPSFSTRAIAPDTPPPRNTR